MRFGMWFVAGLLIASSVPMLGTATEPTYIIKELSAPAPAWFTPEVREAAQEAGAKGMLYNPLTREFVTPQATAPANIPIGSPDYLFIRPGALFLSDSGLLCTYNFIYTGGTQIGAAGHCASFVGETVYILSVPAPTIPLITALGTVASFTNGGIGNDWSLMTINANWRSWVDPNMAYLGGPSCAAWAGSGGVVKHVGHGIQTGLAGAIPRVSQAGVSNGNSFSGIGEVSGGDSGSPMIQVAVSTACAGGLAAGILTHCASVTGLECLPLYWATDIRKVPATVTVGFDPL